MYVNPNFATKKALKVAVAERAEWEARQKEREESLTVSITVGDIMGLREPPMVTVFSPGPFPAKRDGEESVEGPHYPKPHSWYARVRVVNGQVVKVLS